MAAFKNEFTWSKSRDNLFKSCHRAYYYNHYGFWGGWDPSVAPDIRELYIMKNLHTLPSWIGSAVHDKVEQVLRAFQKGRPMSLEQAAERFDSSLRRSLEDSKAGRNRENPKRILGLQSHYYDTTETDKDFEDAIDLAHHCLRTFFEGNVYKRICAVGPEAILSLEELESVQVAGHKVWVKLDLGMRGKGNKMVIVDWKTGKHHEAADVSLQLGIYGLFGTERWEVDAEQLVGFDVNLQSGELRSHPINETVLEEVRHYILSSMTEMKALLADEAENIADINAFEMTDEMWRCRRCNYRKACDRS